jgi:hypothetical protein
MSKLHKNSIIEYAYVYKIIYPNGKIYVGVDYGKTATIDICTYFGSPRSQKYRIKQDHSEILTKTGKLTITKEILKEMNFLTLREILEEERLFINALDSQNPLIGYNG